MTQTSASQVVRLADDGPDRLVAADNEKPARPLHIDEKLAMLVAPIFEYEAVAELLDLRPQSTLGFLVRCQRDLDGIVLECAHRDMQLDGSRRDPGETT